MLLCIYHLLQPDRRIDEGIYNDEIDQYFSYREWKKKHQPLSGVTVREILATEDLNEGALLRIFDGVTAAFYKSDEYNSREYDDFIFVNRYGDVQNQGNLNKALRRMMRDCNDEILEKYGADSDPVLLPQFSCHILRHTFATRLCESGANLKFIQSILGHADVSTTMNIYVDVTDALKKKEITAFDDYMTTKLET